MKNFPVFVILFYLVISISNIVAAPINNTDKQISTSLAVLDFNSIGLDFDEVQKLTQLFRAAFSKQQAYRVYNPEMMYTRMEQKGYSREIPCTDDACIIEVGNVLDVKHMISGMIGKIGDIFSVSLWMLDVKTGKVLTTIMENYRCDYQTFVQEKIPQIVTKIARTLVMLDSRAARVHENKKDSWVTFSKENGTLPTNKILTIEEDKDGTIWVGMKEYGAVYFNGKQWIRFTKKNGLPDNDVWAISRDKHNNLWFGTLGGGVSKYNGKKWKHYTQRKGLSSNYISKIVFDTNDDVWFLSWDSGVSLLHNNKITVYTEKDGLIDNDVRSMCIDLEGNKWFGSYSGVSKFDGKKWDYYKSSYTYGHYSGRGTCNLADNYVRDIKLDNEGNIWFGTYGGITKFDGVTWMSYSSHDGLIDNDVRSLYIDDYGTIWCGTYAGVSKFDGSSWRTFRMSDGLVDNDIRIIKVDSKGNKWFCSSDKGISLYLGP